MKQNLILHQQKFKEIENRIGKEHLSKRLLRQANYSVLTFGVDGIKFYWENIDLVQVVLKSFLKMFGLLKRATHNTIDYQVEELDVYLNSLPKSFQGFSILQLSDLHIDGIVDGGERLRNTISRIDFDLCVITGDFRFHPFRTHDETLKCMEELMDSIQCKEGVIGILGNYDFIEIVPQLEAIGVRILLNEAIPIKREKDVLWIAGVDDPHFFRVHNLSKALQGIPEKAPKILLTHSPEIIKTAAHAGIDYYLCGHTHGGQVCLPGGIPILTNSRCSRKYVSGSWKYQRMTGHTSRGTGSSWLSVRFFCPPEITLHRLFSPSQPLKKAN